MKLHETTDEFITSNMKISCSYFALFLCLALLVPHIGQSEDYSSFDSFNELIKTKKKIFEEDEKKKDVKLSVIERALKYLSQNNNQHKKEVLFKIRENMYDVETWHIFNGKAEDAIRLYAELTTGQNQHNLFVLSDSGKAEDITDLNKIQGGYEFIRDRVFSSPHKFNTKNKIKLILYRKNSDIFICVREGVKDYGSKLKEEGTTRLGKTYDPVKFEFSIDIYHQIDNEKFQYIALDLLDGQSNNSRIAPLNPLKKIGNILSIGTLDKGLEKLIAAEVEKSWDKRNEIFQKLLSKEK